MGKSVDYSSIVHWLFCVEGEVVVLGHVARNDFCGCSGFRILELLIRVSKDTGLGCGCHVAQNYFVLCSEFRI